MFITWTSPVSLRTLFLILPTWSASAAAPDAAAIAGLNWSVSALSAAFRMLFIAVRTSDETVVRSALAKGSTKTAFASAWALPATPSLIWNCE